MFNYQHHPIYQLILPQDSVLPDVGDTPFLPVEDPLLFDLPCLHPSNETEELALSTWINSHLLFFVSLNVGTYVVQQVIDGAVERDLPKVLKWLNRLSVMRLSMVAYAGAAANITRDVYESYIRPAMSSMRSDFSGVSSKDNWVFDDAVNRMKLIVTQLIEETPAEQSLALSEALAAYGEANRIWWTYHGKVMTKLISAPLSLARMTYQKQVDHGSTISYEQFKHATLRTEKAITENDMFFAVARGPVTLPQFHWNLKHILKLVRPLRDTSEEFERYYDDGEALMNVIIQERLTEAREKPTERDLNFETFQQAS
jgi:hypothetical protein